MEQSRPQVLTRALLLSGLALLLASVGLGKEVWPDEAHSLYYYSLEWPRLRNCALPPVYFVFSGLLNPDRNPQLARWLSLAMFGATLATYCYATRKLKTSAFVAGGLLLCTSPILLKHAVEIRCYGLVVLLTFVALALIGEKPCHSRPLLLGLLLCLALLPLTHPIGLLGALAALVTWWSKQENGPLSKLWLGLATITTAFGFWLVAFRALSRLSNGDWIPKPTIHRIANMLLRVVLGKTETSDLSPLPWAAPLLWTSTLCVALFLGSLVLVNRRDPRRREEGGPYLAGALTLLGLILLVSFTVQSLMVPRMFIGLWPYLALFVAFQFEQISSQGIRRGLFVLVLLASIPQAHRWWTWEGHQASEPWSELVQIVLEAPGAKQIVSDGITWYLVEHHFRHWEAHQRLRATQNLAELTLDPNSTVYFLDREYDAEHNRRIRNLLSQQRVEEKVSTLPYGALYRYQAID